MRGAAVFLVRNRETNLGHLLLAERAPFYVQILFRMLLFRNEHELEPLHEDLLEAVGEAQARLSGAPYSQDQFRADLTQLEEWQLITSRIERQRIHGYRDNRRRKYRYKLADESLEFLRWLEERLQDDLENRAVDARNQLEDVSGALKELLRLLRPPHAREREGEDARRVLY